MGESRTVQDSVSLQEIIGHGSDCFDLPLNGDKEEIRKWLAKAVFPILRQIGSADEDILRRIQFLDLLFSKAEDKSLFGGFILAENIFDRYKPEILDPMYAGFYTVAAHEAFQRAFVQGSDTSQRSDAMNHQEQWLFSHVSLSESIPEFKSFKLRVSTTQEDLDSIKNEYKDKILGFTAETWIKSAQENTIDTAWTAYVNNCKKNGINCIAGIPITIPEFSNNTRQNSKLIFVGSLFIGLVEPDKTIAKKHVGIIARHIIPLALRAYGMQAITKSAEKLAEKLQFERSHHMLLHLQKPLDALMKAFDTVQAEAQEMSAILNDPEVGLFKAHKLLAPIFHANREIKISDHLSVVLHHDIKVDNGLVNLHLTFCYAICCIFGVNERLKSAQSPQALAQLAWTALRDTRHLAVYDKLIVVLKTVLFPKGGFPKDWHFEDIVLVNFSIIDEHDDTNRIVEQYRFSNALRALKTICFSPFKDINDRWFDAPIYLAAMDDKFNWDKSIIDQSSPHSSQIEFKHHIIESSATPFAQHAILNFIIGMKSYLKETPLDNDPKFDRKITELEIIPSYSDSLAEYRIKLNSFFFDPKKEIEGLYKCLRASVRVGVSGRNMGNFYGVFQDLLRHGQTIFHDKGADLDDWIIIRYPQCAEPSKKRNIKVLLLLGKKVRNPVQSCAEPIEDKKDSCKENCENVDKVFAICQHAVDDKCWLLRIIWTDVNNLKHALLNLDSGPSRNNGGEPLEEEKGETESSTGKEKVSDMTDAMSMKKTEYAPSSEEAASDEKVRDASPEEKIRFVVIDHRRSNEDETSGWLNALTNIKKLNLSTFQLDVAWKPDNPEQDIDFKDDTVVVLHTLHKSAWINKLGHNPKVKKVICVSTEGVSRDTFYEYAGAGERFVCFADENGTPITFSRLDPKYSAAFKIFYELAKGIK